MNFGGQPYQGEDLHKFLSDLNSLHPNIKFTLSHVTHPGDSCDCPTSTSIPFLDTSVSINDNKIITDLYKKKKSKIVRLLIYPTALCKLGLQNEIANKRKMNDF